MTAKEKKQTCASDICPCMEECPLTMVLGIIGGKWKLAVLCALHNDGPLRYNVLKRKIRGVTNTMLAGTLKELCDANLVRRTQYEEMPVRVEYSTTAAVNELAPILRKLATWGIATLR